MHLGVAAFTDTYLPTVNGVSYTIQEWRTRWTREGGRMDVVFPGTDGYEPDEGEHPVRSLPFPFYQGFRLGSPRVPAAVRDVDVVHAHTPFSIGLAGMRLASKLDVPFVASCHTPIDEYTEYVAPTARIAHGLERVSNSYERWFFDRAETIVAPSESTRRRLIDVIGVDSHVEVIPNGVDVTFFRPVDPEPFLRRYDIDGDRPVIGYTGRQGYEKRLSELLAAVDGMDATVVMGGDGPAHDDLVEQAETIDADVRFLGFLDRQELPELYSALDVFAFPSPVETQGLVALEAFACGTPVVGCDRGALADTIDEGVTGAHYPSGDPDAFRATIRRVLGEKDRLREQCLARREELSVDRSVQRLGELYESLR